MHFTDHGAVRGVTVTHVHFDHVGRIRHLLAAGFTGPIVCSQGIGRCCCT